MAAMSSRSRAVPSLESPQADRSAPEDWRCSRKCALLHLVERREMADKIDIYQKVTDAIDARLKAGVVPWRKPFPGYGRNGGGSIPRNYNSNRPYRGINVFLLAFSGYSSPYWLTF